MRWLYRLLRYRGDAEALARGPGAYARRRGRAQGHRFLARLLHRVVRR